MFDDYSGGGFFSRALRCLSRWVAIWGVLLLIFTALSVLLNWAMVCELAAGLVGGVVQTVITFVVIAFLLLAVLSIFRF